MAHIAHCPERSSCFFLAYSTNEISPFQRSRCQRKRPARHTYRAKQQTEALYAKSVGDTRHKQTCACALQGHCVHVCADERHLARRALHRTTPMKSSANFSTSEPRSSSGIIGIKASFFLIFRRSGNDWGFYNIERASVTEQGLSRSKVFFPHRDRWYQRWPSPLVCSPAPPSQPPA